MSIPKIKFSPECRTAYAEWDSLYRNGFSGTPEYESAMLRMLKLAPAEVINDILVNAKKAGLIHDDMPPGASAEDCAKVASIEAIAKAMRKVGAS